MNSLENSGIHEWDFDNATFVIKDWIKGQKINSKIIYKRRDLNTCVSQFY